MSNSIKEKRSYEMEQIIGRVPNRIIRYGISTLCIVATIGIFISTQISYPDIVRAEGHLRSNVQPDTVFENFTNINQRFKQVVVNGEYVTRGDTVMIDTGQKSNAIVSSKTGRIYIYKNKDRKLRSEFFIWVIPDEYSFDADIIYPSKDSKEVKRGQQVRISLYDYPGNEYGFLEGNIVSSMPIKDGSFQQAIVELKFSKLITTTRKIIPSSPYLHGDAEIQINKKSIFQRIFGSLFD